MSDIPFQSGGNLVKYEADYIVKLKRPLAPKGGNDMVFTPDDVAEYIVNHYQPYGKILEPCRGRGAFTQFMPGCDWCEITEGVNFFEVKLDHYDWVVTNPPWSQFRQFMLRSMEIADNVVFLALLNAWFMRARVRDMQEAGFGIKEALLLETPEKPWPQTGFQLAAVHIKRGYTGNLKLTNWDKN